MLATFHPLKEPVKFPAQNDAAEGEATEIARVEICCSEKKLDSFGSVKSSGRGRDESLDDESFNARKLRELRNLRSSFVFSRFNRSST